MSSCSRQHKRMVNEEIIEANKKPQPLFKSSIFHQKFRSTSTTGKKRTWRSLKQVLAQERSLPWPITVTHCIQFYKIIFSYHILQLINEIILFFADSSINAPPSFKPAKKYSDISGLPVSIGTTS